MSATTTPKAEAGGTGNGAAQTEMISGGHLVAKALKAEGIDVIYTLCGGHIIDIYDGCVDEGIEVVDVRHEQVAAAQRVDAVDALGLEGLGDEMTA